MIAVDTSAIVAIFRSEDGADEILTKLERSNRALMSAANALELQLVLGGERAIESWPRAEEFFRTNQIAIHPFDERQLHFARDAAVRYGKGRHKARLNFGDCFAYALAKAEDIPLLCTGADFAETDVVVA